MTPPPEILAAAQLITEWAENNHIREFAIAGVQQRKREPRAIYGCGGDPLDDDRADEFCTDYHCAGDCGLRGHGYRHR